jgi:hypothetical protein
LSGGHIILVDSFLMVKYMYIKFIENTEHCIICIKYFQYLIQFVGYSLNHLPIIFFDFLVSSQWLGYFLTWVDISKPC